MTGNDGGFRQDIREHGVGFQGGQHIHQHAGYTTGTATLASIDATGRQRTIGGSISALSMSGLGVHPAISGKGEQGPVPYLLRDHDIDIRRALRTLNESGTSTKLLLVVGTSCTGKSRTAYEAVRAELNDWQVIAPRTDSELAKAIVDGVPTRSIIWIDEVQDKMTLTAEGILAAKALSELVHSETGPILVLGTVWPDNLALLRRRVDPEGAMTGAGVVGAVLETAELIHVPNSFAPDELADVRDDSRLAAARATASRAQDDPDRIKLTQVLAGGTQLVARYDPPAGSRSLGAFSPAARSILQVIGDLRRVGYPNSVPSQAAAACAPSYLGVPAPIETWLTPALEELMTSASEDDPLTNTAKLDIHASGVPSLSPRWSHDRDGGVEMALSIHDYLYEYYKSRNTFTPVPVAVWRFLEGESDRLPNPVSIANAALQRGLLSTAIAILSGESARGQSNRSKRLAIALAHRATEEDLEQLRTMRASGQQFAGKKLAQALARRTDTGAIDELTLLIDVEPAATTSLNAALKRRGSPEDWVRLRERARAGDRHAGQLVSASNGLSRSRSKHKKDDVATLRALADSGGSVALHRLAVLLADVDNDDSLEELRRTTVAGAGGLVLLRKLRQRNPNRVILELDTEGQSVFAEPPAENSDRRDLKRG